MQVSFEIYNTETVEQLKEENPDILPTYSVDSDADLEYNKKQINSAIESAIIQGKSIDGIAEDLESRLKSINESSAVRAARTAITCAQNSGSLEGWYEARDKGVNVQKQWIASLDDRTRESHADIDQEVQELEDEFSNGLQYPGDPSGDPSEVYNCRCSMKGFLPDYDTDTDDEGERFARDPETGEAEYVSSNLTYNEWLSQKEKISSSEISARNTSRGNAQAITHFNAELNTRQQKILNELPDYDSRTIVKKNKVGMADLAAITAKTGVEYAMFTKGGERLIVRGAKTYVNITVSEAKKMAAEGYKWSGHTHPGFGVNVLQASDGDYEVLKAFGQKQSVIYNSLGEYWTFEADN